MPIMFPQTWSYIQLITKKLGCFNKKQDKDKDNEDFEDTADFNDEQMKAKNEKEDFGAKDSEIDKQRDTNKWIDL